MRAVFALYPTLRVCHFRTGHPDDSSVVSRGRVADKTSLRRDIRGADRLDTEAEGVGMGIGEILAWLVIGLLGGAIAKAILPGDDPGGIVVTIIIGIVGALLGGWLGGLLGLGSDGDTFDFGTLLTAIVGSIILLLIYRMVAGNRGRARV